MRKEAVAKKSILIVEDDAIFLSYLRAGLVGTGYRVLSAKDENGALRLLDSAHPDLVVLSILTPAGGRLELLRRLRDVSRVPVIVTGPQATGDEVAGVADDFIDKPFLPGDLRKRIKRLLTGWPFPFCAEAPAG